MAKAGPTFSSLMIDVSFSITPPEVIQQIELPDIFDNPSCRLGLSRPSVTLIRFGNNQLEIRWALPKRGFESH